MSMVEVVLIDGEARNDTHLSRLGPVSVVQNSDATDDYQCFDHHSWSASDRCETHAANRVQTGLSA